MAVATLRERLGALPGESHLEDLAAQVASGKLDPYTAADELIAGSRSGTARPRPRGARLADPGTAGSDPPVWPARLTPPVAEPRAPTTPPLFTI